jgi:TPP-dependent pyruvate/acetoin dehydrogenase alpha subunit
MSGKAEKNRLYKVLEISPDASDAEIKKAYRKLAMVRISEKWVKKEMEEGLTVWLEASSGQEPAQPGGCWKVQGYAFSLPIPKKN